MAREWISSICLNKGMWKTFMVEEAGFIDYKDYLFQDFKKSNVMKI